MQIKRTKFLMLALLFVAFMFFTSDLGLIDVEKTSIITAVAIDKEDEEYIVTAQIAVPEATDTNTENQKAQISGKGSTVGAALKDLGDTSGWFPKLSFCNLILIGESLAKTNVMDALDYFAKTLRVQDSALVVACEKSAKDILALATPLDNISSFAIQKILLKTIGFNRDIATTDIKTFCSGHYSDSGSAYMPVVKYIKADEPNSESGESSSASGSDKGSQSSSNSESGKKENSDNLFDATTTALFKNGYKVGELDENLSLFFNAFGGSFNGTTIPIDGVPFGGKTVNYLLTVINKISSVKLSATENDLTLKLNLSLYCKIADVSTDYSEDSLSNNAPLPKPLIEKAESLFTKYVSELVETSVQTECDIFKIKEKLYRHNYKQYSRYKDNYFSVLKTDINVNVYGQSQ